MARPFENFAPSNLGFKINGDLFFNGASRPSLFTSLPCSLSAQKQPPLLPLPIPKPYYSSLPSRIHGALRPPCVNRKTNRSRDQNRTPKKNSKPSISTPKKQEKDQKSTTTMTMTTKTDCLMIASTNRLGPDPSDLPKEVSRVLKPIVLLSADTTCVEDMDELSGSVFSQSPPPSSLPLPKFSLMKPKVSCNTEAGGIDAGATDDLRRLLRLR